MDLGRRTTIGLVVLLNIATVLGAYKPAWCGSDRGQSSLPSHVTEAPEDTANNFKMSSPVPIPVDGLPNWILASAAPDDANELLVCTFEADAETARRFSAAYSSFDNGNSWTRTLLDAKSAWVSETSCGLGPDRRAYFLAGVSGERLGENRHSYGTTEFYRSPDGGANWLQAHRYPFIDWATLAIVPSPTEDFDRLYLFGNNIARGIGDTGMGSPEPLRRPLLIAKDGISFEAPQYPPDQDPRGRPVGSFPLSTAVLENRTVLVLYARQPEPNAPSLQLSLYKVQGDKYDFVSTIAMPSSVSDYSALGTQLAFDGSRKHHGRLFVALDAGRAQNRVLLLATSDNEGQSWRVKILATADSALDYVVDTHASVAVDRAGNVGILWQPKGNCPRFVISTDGGESVKQSLMMGSCQEQKDPSQLPRWLAQHTVSIYERSHSVKASMMDAGEPGFTLFVLPSTTWTSQVATDAAGKFHVFWPEVQSDGTTALLTSKIGMRLESPAVDPRSDLQDISSRAFVKIVRQSFDAKSSVFHMDVAVENISSANIPYPSMLKIYSGKTDCGSLRYVSPVSMLPQNGLVLHIPQIGNGPYLNPGQKTLPLHLELRIEGCDIQLGLLDASRQVSGRTIDSLSLKFHIYSSDRNGHATDSRDGTDP
jgi:hypothetical protein